MTEREKLLREAIKTVTQDRQTQYGEPENNLQMIADMWNTYLRQAMGMSGIDISAKDASIMMVLLKIARSTTGKNKADNYTDMCGYAALAYEMMVADDPEKTLPDEEPEPEVMMGFAKAHECCGGCTE